MLLISIVIPCFNYGKFLITTLECVKEQSYQNWECIIVDDGSTDETKQIVERFIESDERFRYIYQENKGVSAARNNGILSCYGDFIQFLDADDLIECHKFKEQIEIFNNDSSIDIVYSSARYFRNSIPTERLYFMEIDDLPWMLEFTGNGNELLPVLAKSNIMAIHCPLIRRSTIDHVGLFNEELSYLEDWEYWFRCAYLNKRFYYCNHSDTLSLVRIHDGSVSNNKWAFRFNEYLLKQFYFKRYLEINFIPDFDNDVYFLKRRLVGLILFDFLKGNFAIANNKLKLISQKDGFIGGVAMIFYEKIWPTVNLKMLRKGFKGIFRL